MQRCLDDEIRAIMDSFITAQRTFAGSEGTYELNRECFDLNVLGGKLNMVSPFNLPRQHDFISFQMRGFRL